MAARLVGKKPARYRSPTPVGACAFVLENTHQLPEANGEADKAHRIEIAVLSDDGLYPRRNKQRDIDFDKSHHRTAETPRRQSAVGKALAAQTTRQSGGADKIENGHYGTQCCHRQQRPAESAGGAGGGTYNNLDCRAVHCGKNCIHNAGKVMAYPPGVIVLNNYFA